MNQSLCSFQFYGILVIIIFHYLFFKFDKYYVFSIIHNNYIFDNVQIVDGFLSFLFRRDLFQNKITSNNFLEFCVKTLSFTLSSLFV